MDFWMLRMQTGYRLSNPKRRKAAKIHAFGRVRIILATLYYLRITAEIGEIVKLCFKLAYKLLKGR